VKSQKGNITSNIISLTKIIWGVPMQETASYRRFVDLWHQHLLEVSVHYASEDEFFHLLRPPSAL
jgi:hypothetical protein